MAGPMNLGVDDVASRDVALQKQGRLDTSVAQAGAQVGQMGMQLGQMAMALKHQKMLDQQRIVSQGQAILGSNWAPIEAKIQAGNKILQIMGIPGTLTQEGVAPFHSTITDITKAVEAGKDPSPYIGLVETFMANPSYIDMSDLAQLAKAKLAIGQVQAKKAADVMATMPKLPDNVDPQVYQKETQALKEALDYNKTRQPDMPRPVPLQSYADEESARQDYERRQAVFQQYQTDFDKRMRIEQTFQADPSFAKKILEQELDPKVSVERRALTVIADKDPTTWDEADRRVVTAYFSHTRNHEGAIAFGLSSPQIDLKRLQLDAADNNVRLSSVSSLLQGLETATSESSKLSETAQKAIKDLPKIVSSSDTNADALAAQADGGKMAIMTAGDQYRQAHEKDIQYLTGEKGRVVTQLEEAERRRILTLGDKTQATQTVANLKSWQKTIDAMITLSDSHSPYRLASEQAQLADLTRQYELVKGGGDKERTADLKKELDFQKETVKQMETDQKTAMDTLRAEQLRLTYEQRKFALKETVYDKRSLKEQQASQAAGFAWDLVRKSGFIMPDDTALAHIAQATNIPLEDIKKQYSVFGTQDMRLAAAQIEASSINPSATDVVVQLGKVAKRYGVKITDIAGALKDVNKPAAEININTKQTVAEAGKLANVNQAISELQQVRQTFINPDGSINRTQMVAGAWSLPFTKGKGAAQFIEKAVEIKLRAATGAAARPDEMRMYEKMFGPSAFDSDEIIKYKLDSFENWMQTVAETTDPEGELRSRAEALLNKGTVSLLTTPEYQELRTKFPQASASDIVRFLQSRKKKP